MKIEVGSIIYIIDPKSKTVVPARVNEQVVSRTLQGENISHNVEVPSGKVVSLESLQAIFYNSLDEVRVHLLERAKEVVEAGIKDAESVAAEKFGIAGPISPPIDVPSVQEGMQITLEDGTKANVKIPSEFLNESVNH